MDGSLLHARILVEDSVGGSVWNLKTIFNQLWSCSIYGWKRKCIVHISCRVASVTLAIFFWLWGRGSQGEAEGRRRWAGEKYCTFMMLNAHTQNVKNKLCGEWEQYIGRSVEIL